ncbi:MAG TPA: hypothetical protein PKE26_07845 [Kiritimatiellia bacterium]|nr:hypothetical protein [Kiritimatiellia bacterium]HMO99004.1 hypothetical protein [Kiritimatiellia bacterium]HMP95891.1 hypothetical protein [Kiritimatiellia bacterium]
MSARISIGERDETGVLLPQLERAAAARNPVAGSPPDEQGLPADRLADAKDVADYRQRLIALIREQSAVVIEDFKPPVRRGWIGILMQPWRRFWWKQLRYQHEKIAAQHNAVTALIVAALDEQDQRLKELERRAEATREPDGQTDAQP